MVVKVQYTSGQTRRERFVGFATVNQIVKELGSEPDGSRTVPAGRQGAIRPYKSEKVSWRRWI